LNWKDRDIELWREGKTWGEIVSALSAEYPDIEFNKDKVRDPVRRLPEYGKPKEIDISEAVKKALKTRTKITDLCARFKCSQRVIQAHIDDLREQSLDVESENGYVWIQTKPIQSDTQHKMFFKGKVYKFGVVSDTHLNSKHQQLTHLNHFYDVCEHREIQDVFHAGDLTDGYYKNRPDHIYEIFNVGFDEQAAYTADAYPYRTGMQTHFIIGNHDYTHIINGGANIGKKVASERDDMEYLGSGYTKIWLTENCDLDLLHPLDGAAYAISYSTQKYIDSLQGGDKPKILIVGHHHKAFHLPGYRNIQAFEAACFEKQTPFMRGKKLTAWVGGWIMTVTVDCDGHIETISTEYIPYYRMIENDY
jgi:predicted phosphodiesterase